MTASAPLSEVHACEPQIVRRNPGTRIKIDVPVHAILVVRPITPEQHPLLEVNDVRLKRKTHMRLGPRALELVVAAEGKNIISHDVGCAVVLVKPAVRRAVNQITLGNDAAAAFIEIDTPAAILPTGDVVPKVVADPRSGLHAERVDAAHVAQDRPVTIRFHTDVVHVIERDDVIRSQRRPVAPGPAYGNAGVVEIVDGVMDNAIAPGLPEPNPYRARKHFPAIVNVAIGELIAAVLFLRLISDRGLAQFQSAGPKILELAMLEAITAAAAGQFQAVVAKVSKRAALK